MYSLLWYYNYCYYCLIVTITILSNVISALAALFFTNYSVQLKSDSVIRWLAVIGQLKQSITELITITIATTIYPKTKLRNFQMEILFLTLDVSTGYIWPKCIYSFRNLWLWLIGNRNSCCSILSIIILVIDKLDSPLGSFEFVITPMITDWMDPTWSITYHYYILNKISHFWLVNDECINRL